MNRSEFEQWLQDFYEARLSNDADRCMQFFAAHSKFRLAGSANASTIARASDSLSASEHKVVEFHQFVDTAAIERLVTQARAVK